MTTLQDIIDDCRRRIDMKVNQFWTDADFTAEINKSLSQLDMILISKFNDYKLTSVITSVTGNTITLPDDFLKLRGVDVVTDINSSDGYITVEPFSFKRRNSRPFASAIGVLYEMQYRLQGNTIVILPASVASQYQYRIWYTPDFIPLENPTDTLEPYMDSQSWFEYAVLDTCAKCQAAQDLNAQTFLMQKEELKQMIISLSAPNRDAGEPAFIVNTERDFSFGWDL